MTDVPNESQQKLIDTKEGFVVVDAGPGTGKTKTIVERYVDILETRRISPENILMVTFTRNATGELSDRIKVKMIESKNPDVAKDAAKVVVKTFDSFCHSIVSDGAEDVGGFFGFNIGLTRAVTIDTNRTLVKNRFQRFLDGFMEDYGDDHGDAACIAATESSDIYDLIEQLMSDCVFPTADGWFGIDCETKLYGDNNLLIEMIKKANYLGKRKRRSDLAKYIHDLKSDDVFGAPDSDTVISDDAIIAAANEDRTALVKFIHDLYLAYIHKSIEENRLTYKLNAMFAFTLLYSDDKLRERHSFDYVTIDEFQDTDANQLMISMMVLRKGNLCAVGDWKQGIYGFRCVSIENIVDFDNRVAKAKGFLGGERVLYSIGTPIHLVLDKNYRSSEAVIRESFRVLKAPATEDDGVKQKHEIVPLKASNEEACKNGHVRYVKVDDKDFEPTEVVRCIKDYVCPGRYLVNESVNGVSIDRNMCYGDIAVLCAKKEQCRAVMNALVENGIPAYMQGDVSIMETTEGKLALAWLKHVANPYDPRGYVPIMAHAGYSMVEIQRVELSAEYMPE